VSLYCGASELGGSGGAGEGSLAFSLGKAERGA